MTSGSTRREIIDESRASFLLGLPADQLREISALSGLGRTQVETGAETLVFTYEELYRLCRLIVGPSS